MITPLSFRMVRILDVARRSDLPCLLVGKHGIGKSAFLESYAQKRNLELTVLDLSLLEATDLTGIPFIENKKTHFAAPAILPDGQSKKSHMIVFEELNRCDLTLRQPCLQLLTARKLNSYSLPKDCFLVSSINPFGAGYDVEELDPALASRFLRLDVEPDSDSWLHWARQNRVHRTVILFIERYPQSLDRIPPRTWTYVSQVLTEMEQLSWSLKEASPIIESFLGDVAFKAFFRFIKEKQWKARVVSAGEIFARPSAYIEYIQVLTQENRTGILSVLTTELAKICAQRVCSETKKAELQKILDVLPEDLSLSILNILEESKKIS